MSEDGVLNDDDYHENPTYSPEYHYRMWAQADHHSSTSTSADEVPADGYKPWRIKSYFIQQPVNPYTGSTNDCWSEQVEYFFLPDDNVATYYNQINPSDADGDSNVYFSLGITAAYPFSSWLSAGASIGITWDLLDTIHVDDQYNGQDYNVHWTLDHSSFSTEKDYAGVEVHVETGATDGTSQSVDIQTKWGFTYTDPGTSVPVYTETATLATTAWYTAVDT